MPKLKSFDGGHTAFYDHWIRVQRASPQQHEDSVRLRAWREPPEAFRSRNLALAYISSGSKNNNSTQLLTGHKLLGTRPADGAVETARGLVLLRMKKSTEAVEAFRRAVEEQPSDSSRRLNLAAAQWAAGAKVEAKRSAEQAIELEPLLEDAYVLLAEMEPGQASYWKDRYQKLVPERRLP